MTWIYNGTPELDAKSTYKTGLVVCIVVPVVMFAVVGLRLYTRLRVVCKVGVDDYLTVLAVGISSASSKKTHTKCIGRQSSQLHTAPSG